MKKKMIVQIAVNKKQEPIVKPDILFKFVDTLRDRLSDYEIIAMAGVDNIKVEKESLDDLVFVKELNKDDLYKILGIEK